MYVVILINWHVTQRGSKGKKHSLSYADVLKSNCNNGTLITPFSKSLIGLLERIVLLIKRKWHKYTCKFYPFSLSHIPFAG